MITFIVSALALMALVFLLLVLSAGQKRQQQITYGVSEAGYETAFDILFPGKSNRLKRPLRYGPVLPSKR